MGLHFFWVESQYGLVPKCEVDQEHQPEGTYLHFLLEDDRGPFDGSRPFWVDTVIQIMGQIEQSGIVPASEDDAGYFGESMAITIGKENSRIFLIVSERGASFSNAKLKLVFQAWSAFCRAPRSLDVVQAIPFAC